MLPEENEEKWPRARIYATFAVDLPDKAFEWYHRMLGWKVGNDGVDDQGNCTFEASYMDITPSILLFTGKRSRRIPIRTSL